MACPRNLQEGRDRSETQIGLVRTTRSQHWSNDDPVNLIHWDPVGSSGIQWPTGRPGGAPSYTGKRTSASPGKQKRWELGKTRAKREETTGLAWTQWRAGRWSSSGGFWLVFWWLLGSYSSLVLKSAWETLKAGAAAAGTFSFQVWNSGHDLEELGSILCAKGDGYQ